MKPFRLYQGYCYFSVILAFATMFREHYPPPFNTLILGVVGIWAILFLILLCHLLFRAAKYRLGTLMN